MGGRTRAQPRRAPPPSLVASPREHDLARRRRPSARGARGSRRALCARRGARGTGRRVRPPARRRERARGRGDRGNRGRRAGRPGRFDRDPPRRVARRSGHDARGGTGRTGRNQYGIRAPRLRPRADAVVPRAIVRARARRAGDDRHPLLLPSLRIRVRDPDAPLRVARAASGHRSLHRGAGRDRERHPRDGRAPAAGAERLRRVDAALRGDVALVGRAQRDAAARRDAPARDRRQRADHGVRRERARARGRDRVG